jgi:hypothetical protein
MTTLDRAAARRKILQAANRQRLRNPAHRALPLYGMRHLQRAVAVVRHHRLVDVDVLTAAGFRAERPR